MISADVNPSTGEALGGKHQVFRAHVSAADSTDTIQWQQLSNDPARHNIRPLFASGDEHSAILWLRGTYNTYTDYYMDVVGILN